MWKWMHRKRTGVNRLVAPSIGILIVGVGMWAWSLYRDVDPDDQALTFARTYVVLGMIGILIPLAVMWNRKRSANRTGNSDG